MPDQKFNKNWVCVQQYAKLCQKLSYMKCSILATSREVQKNKVLSATNVKRSAVEPGNPEAIMKIRNMTFLKKLFTLVIYEFLKNLTDTRKMP